MSAQATWLSKDSLPYIRAWKANYGRAQYVFFLALSACFVSIIVELLVL